MSTHLVPSDAGVELARFLRMPRVPVSGSGVLGLCSGFRGLLMWWWLTFNGLSILTGSRSILISSSMNALQLLLLG